MAIIELIPYVTGKTPSDIMTCWYHLGGNVYNPATGTFNSYVDANTALYEVPCTNEQGATGVYEVAVPIHVDLPKPITMTFRSRDKVTGQIVAVGQTNVDINSVASPGPAEMALQSSSDAIKTRVDLLATQASLDATHAVVITRADQSTLTTKASQSSVDAVKTRVDLLSTQASLDANKTATDLCNTNINTVNNNVNTRSTQTSVDAIALDVKATNTTLATGVAIAPMFGLSYETIQLRLYAALAGDRDVSPDGAQEQYIHPDGVQVVFVSTIDQVTGSRVVAPTP